MENQHRKIKGYRELGEQEIANMNEGKAMEAQFLEMLDRHQEQGADPRWIAIGRTHMQLALMAAGRAVARPEGYPEPQK